MASGNKGTVSIRKRAGGPVWLYRYQTTRASDGKRVENTEPVGKVKDVGKSKVAAWMEVARLGLHLLAENPSTADLTFADLAAHYRLHELQEQSGVRDRADETVSVHELLLRRWILPRWGQVRVSEIRPVLVEQWFKSLASTPFMDNRKPLEWPSITKIKAVMSLVFQNAQRHELIPGSLDSKGRPTNPIALARTKCESDYEGLSPARSD